MGVEETVAVLDAAIRERVVPGRAEAQRAYLKSDLEFYGVAVGDVRAAVRLAGRPDHAELVALVSILWQSPVFEHRLAAVELLCRHVRLLGPADVPLVERLVRESHTWALVDPLAITVAGPIVTPADLDHWAADPDFWVRRAALLAHLAPLRGGDGDFEAFARYADQMLDEREFFIRKAIGWVLRDTGRKRPDLVFDWLLPRAARASTVTVREAVKPLSDDQRAAIAVARAG